MKAFSLVVSIYFFLCHSLFLQSQNNKYFQKGFFWEENINNHGIRVIQKPNNGNFLIIGPTNDYSGIIEGFVFEMNEYGTMVQVLEFKEEGFNRVILRDLKITEEGIALVGFVENEAEVKWYSYFLHIDEDGNILHKKIGDDLPYNNAFFTMTPTPDGNYLVAGQIAERRGSLSYMDPFLMKIDKEGNELWQKQYYPYSKGNRFDEIIPNEDQTGYYLLGTVGYNVESGEPLIMEIDEDGNVIWEKIYDVFQEDSFSTIATSIAVTNDNQLMFTALVNSVFAYGYIVKLDSSRNIEWRNDGDLFYSETIKEVNPLADGTYVAVGANSNYLISGKTRTDADMQLAKLSAEGEVLWERRYGGLSSDYGFDMMVTEEGGFIVCGRLQSLELTDADFGAALYVVKTNCMGLLTEPQTSFSAEQDPENPLTYHFTNHSEYVYPDSIDGGHFLWDFGDGATSEELHPTHSYANKGESRIVTLTAVVCSDTSRFDIKVVTGEEIVGIEGVDGLPAFSFKLYPNPTSSGQVFLDYDLPKEGLLQLYDLQGKEVGNWRLDSQNKELILDLEKLRSGMYVYRLTSEGAFLKGGKLVVE
ncbi:MAG: T9SS type A sorting domain-containing protein [Chitinophagales bacterium]